MIGTSYLVKKDCPIAVLQMVVSSEANPFFFVFVAGLASSFSRFRSITVPFVKRQFYWWKKSLLKDDSFLWMAG